MANRNFMKHVLMGNGIAKWDGFDLGFLSGKSQFDFSYDIEKLKVGQPLVTVGQETKEISATLRCPLAEFSPENVSINLGGLAVQVTSSGQAVVDADNQVRTFGGNYNGSGWQFISLDGLNIENLVLKNEAEDVTYVEGTDYLILGSLDKVLRLPGGDIDPDETVHPISYDYDQVTGKQINLGAEFNLSIGEAEFVHPRSKYNKKKITIRMHKAQASGNVSMPFEDGKFAVTDLVIEGIFSDEHPLNPFGWIHWED